MSGTNSRGIARRRTQPTVPHPEAEEQSGELQAVIDLARTVISDDAVSPWLRSPNPGLDNRTPLDVIAAGEYQRVVDLLHALAEGVTS
ncbi:antitoxin Xre/MbcA/ParS toxin-binding domain-containing protein [Candidatus Poriferisodalis sp.]|uniref:antitoxin Xre/MbcA/ParS toxin-binding domain-containing protein n=1 Tax=Candidatus Poriferisodalis sp. TaxID=3101277 RepID=UPI003B017120